MLLVLLLAACTADDPAWVDADQDGFPAEVDCDDQDADAFPGAIEFCDGRDNDCDGQVDEGPPWDAHAWFPDADGDGAGCADCAPVVACAAPAGHVRDGTDCDDADPAVRPGVVEQCNGVDDDCDGLIDEDPGVIGFVDADGDGFGDPEAPVRSCAPGPDVVADGTDCDDTDHERFPGAPERCNQLDDDCDGLVDEDPAAPPTWYPDADGDGAGAPAPFVGCEPPPGPWVQVGGDCDDLDDEVHPGALERCDGRDEDCDGVVDGPDAPLLAGPRAPLTLHAPAPTLAAVAWAPLQHAGGEVRVALGDCATGLVELPARFVDGWEGLGVPGTEGDGLGALVVVYDTDGDGATAELLAAGTHTGWVYLDAPAPGPGDAEARADGLVGARSALALDGIRADGLVADGPSVFDQRVWGPRVDTPAGPLAPEAGIVLDDHPAVARVRADQVVSNGAGAVRFQIDWWRVASRPELWFHVQATVEQPTTVAGLASWRDGVSLFAGAAELQAEGPLWTGTDLGLRLDGWPAGAVVSAQDGVLAVIGSEAEGDAGPLVSLPAGAALGAVRGVLVPDADPLARLAELDAGLTLDVGAPVP